MDKRRLLIDVAFALESYNVKSYLNLDSLEVVQLPEYNWHQDEWYEQTVDDIQRNPGMYVLIEPLISQDAFMLMTEFAETVQDNRLKSKLFNALSRSKAFYNFKNLLYDYPDTLMEWHIFKYMLYHEKAEEWLMSHRIIKVEK